MQSNTEIQTVIIKMVNRLRRQGNRLVAPKRRSTNISVAYMNGLAEIFQADTSLKTKAATRKFLKNFKDHSGMQGATRLRQK